MRLPLIALGLTLAVLCGMGGCDRSGNSSSGGAAAADDEDVSTDPVKLAERVDEYAAEELKKSKIDARQWLASPNHGTFEAEKKDIVKLTNDVIAAGAVGVWIGEAEKVENNEIISEIYVELPTDAGKRGKIFEIYNKDTEKYEAQEKEVGQKYLDFSWD